MKMKTLIVILIFGSIAHGFGQSGDYCGKKKLAVSDIKKLFPFDKTATIKLVSFKHEYPVMQESDTVEVPIDEPEIPKSNGTVDLTKMFETKTLDRRLTDEVIDILVNYDNEDRSSEVAVCYEPRNGILFFDTVDNIIGYVEICFDCSRYKVEPNTMAVTTFCPEKFDALKGIFKEAGIIYGTVQSRDR